MVGLLHVNRHLIQKKLYDEGVVNFPILQLGKLRHRGSNEVASSEIDDFFEANNDTLMRLQSKIVAENNITSYEKLEKYLEKHCIYDGTPEEMIDYLKEFAKTIVPELESDPDITIKEMDEASAKVSNAVAYYMKSAIDNTAGEYITLNPDKLAKLIYKVTNKKHPKYICCFRFHR